MALQKVDKVLLGTVIPVIVGIVIVAIVLAVVIHPCPRGLTYNADTRMCRKKCAGEGKPHGQTYNAKTKQCECPDSAPVLNAKTQECVGQCDPGETWNAKTQSCDPAPLNACSPKPSVNADTGAIQNGNHFTRTGNTCSAGTDEEYTALCTASACDNPAFCNPGDRWYGYANGKCVKHVACNQLLCDADYCESESVKRVVGTLYKVQRGDACINPSDAEVGDMCLAAANTAWQSPYCYSTQVNTSVNVSVTSASLDTGIEGKLTQTLVNGSLDLDASGVLLYVYTLSLNDQTLSNFATVTPCQSSKSSDSRVCFDFAITLPSTLPPGKYTLSFSGYPSWDKTRPLYMSQPLPLPLTKSDAASTIIPDLNVKPSRALALKVAGDTDLVATNLKRAQALYPDFASSIDASPTTLAVGVDPNDKFSTLLVVGCTDAYCKFGETVPFKLIVIAWPPVALTDATLCKDAGSTQVKYSLTRTTTLGTTVLIGPTPGENQPSEEEVQSGIISFIDVVPVNTGVTYTLLSYLAPPNDPTLTYDLAVCKSDSKNMYSVIVDAYTNEFCHRIAVPGKVPPYMSKRGGICAWDGTPEAQDFYCMYSWPGTTKRPKTPGFHEDQLALYDGQDCSYVNVTYPVFPEGFNNPWTSSSCNPPTYDPRVVCATGVEQKTQVVCPNYLTLETRPVYKALTVSSLADRLNAVNAAFSNLSYDSSFVPVDNKDNRLFTMYNRCGPHLSNSYGTTSTLKSECDPTADKSLYQDCLDSACDKDDQTCQVLGAVANCLTNDCAGWVDDTEGTPAQATFDLSKEHTFHKTRQCKIDFHLANTTPSPCCNNRVFIPSGDVTGLVTEAIWFPREQFCGCPERFGGAFCELDPCPTMFSDASTECSPPDTVCDGTNPACVPQSYSTRTGYCIAAPGTVSGVECKCIGKNQLDPLNTRSCVPPDTYFTFPAPNFDLPKGKRGTDSETKYLVHQVGKFTTYHRNAKVDNPGIITLQIGGGSGKDRAQLGLYLFAGTVDPKYNGNQYFSSLPPNQVIFHYDEPDVATRDHDSHLQLDAKFQGCTKPGYEYTLAIVLTFPKGYGTDDVVRVRSPDLVIRTHNMPVGCW